MSLSRTFWKDGAVLALAVAARNYGEEKIRCYTAYGKLNPVLVDENKTKAREAYACALVEVLETIESDTLAYEFVTKATSKPRKPAKKVTKRAGRKGK
jgi:hypothetical protein